MPGKSVRLLKAHTLACIATLTLGALPHHSVALGLGDIRSDTAVGQRLAAEIAIVAGPDEDYSPDTIKLRRLERDEAAALGIEVLSGFQRYRFTPRMKDGRLVAELRSEGPINEPFLNFVVELKWPKGSVVREYTLLLDIPDLAAATVQRADPGPAAPGFSPSPPSRTMSRVRSAEPAPLSADTEHYRVRIGDTLSGIAQRWADTRGVSRARALQWLHANNPQAFAGGDINRLQAGVMLRLPGAAGLSSEQAPGVAAPSADTASPAPTPPVPPAAQLRLSAPASQGSAITGAKLHALSDTELQAHLDATNEQLDRLSRENEELRARLNRLEKLDYLQSLERLLALREQQIAELQQAANSQGAVTSTAPRGVSAETKASNTGTSSGTAQAGILRGVDDTALKASPSDTGSGTDVRPWWLALLFALLATLLIPAVYLYTRPRARGATPRFAPAVAIGNGLPPVQQGKDDAIDLEQTPRPEPVPQAPRGDRRPDHIVQQSIRNKMAGYVPPMEELGELHDQHDDIDDLVSEAMAYANRGQFEIASAMIRGEQMRVGEDSRLDIAMHFIQRLRQDFA
ncbi:MAG TPA: hypothetical protein VL027_08645 [Spongiibacteraceae bacterium]|nr:hypothetical protein [Spongiibacteraceae bacterium]